MYNVHCYVCRDKSKGDIVLSDAQRILAHLERIIEYVKYKEYDLRSIPKNSKFIYRGAERELCYSYVHTMCGNCHEVDIKLQQAHMLEEKIAKGVISLHCLMLQIKDTDKEVYGYLKSHLIPLLSGYYPKAAKLIIII